MSNTEQAPDIISVYNKFHKIMDKPGFSPIIKCASKIFNAPVIFTDEDYHMISLYPVKKIGDEVYDTLLETGSLSIETIAAFQEAYLQEPGNRYEPFFVNNGLVKNMPRIFAEVYDDKNILGHIGIFINLQEAEPWQLDAAAILTSTLRIKINLTKDFIPSLSRDLNELINRNGSNQTKNSSASNISKTFRNPGILLVAPFDQNKAQQAFISVVLNHCLHKFPNTIPAIHKTDLVVLITDEKKQPLHFMQKTAQEIAMFLSQYKITCGAVYPIDNLYLLPNYYLQGRLTALLKLKNENSKTILKYNLKSADSEKCEKDLKLTYYSEVAPEPMYLYMSANPEYSAFVSPVLKSINDYDMENNTEYLPTLKCYCQSLFHKNETSYKLHIHRNTLMYRLNRIEELFALDLKDFKVLHQLLISFELIGATQVTQCH